MRLDHRMKRRCKKKRKEKEMQLMSMDTKHEQERNLCGCELWLCDSCFSLQPQAYLSNNTREVSTHGHHQTVNTEIRLIIFFAAKDGEALYSSKTKLGADCGSDHELLIAKIRLKLKKVGKTSRPFR